MPEFIDDYLEDEDINDDEENSEALTVRFATTVDKGQEPTRIDRFLFTKIEGASRNKIQQGLANGLVLVNEEMVKSNYKIRPEDHIIVYDTKPVDYNKILPEKMDLDIIYEDDQLMVINKAAGMVVHPGTGNPTGTLINGIAYYLHGPDPDEDVMLNRIGLVHRIDKDTSGLLLIAKTDEAMKDLAIQFKDRTIFRQYMGLVWGNVDKDEGTITGNIGRNQRHRQLMDVFPDGDRGKIAITHFKTLERLQYVSLLSFQLETGRTHQIRVHAKHMGHVLFGDTTYGGDKIHKGTVYAKYKQFVDGNFKILNRQALHAYELEFTHPKTQEKMNFKSPLPADIEKVLERWRVYTNTYNT